MSGSKLKCHRKKKNKQNNAENQKVNLEHKSKYTLETGGTGREGATIKFSQMG